jgi:gluconokinase
MKKPIWIGVDIGTAGVRAAAYEADGQCHGAASREYGLQTPRPGWVEQDPAEIVAAMEAALQELSGLLARRNRKPDGITLSSVFHSFLAYDRKLRPITRLMSWADTRSQPLVADMKMSGLEYLSVYRRVGCPMHPTYPFFKIAWLLKQQPELRQQSPRFGSIKDYAFMLLTGRWVMDRSIASGSGLYNQLALEWDKELMQFLGIAADSLPEVVSTTYSRPLSDEAAQRTGLPSGLPIVIGAGDGVLVNVGVGAVQPGQMSATIGTSGAVRILSDRPRTDEKGRTWCYNLTDDRWVLGGAINNGGIVLRWLRDNFGQAEQAEAKKLGVDPYALLTLAAGKVPAGSDGLILLPFLLGERAPNWNADARGVLFGLTLGHGRNHLIRATMEGICYCMNSILLVLEQVAGPAGDIRVSGSFTRSEFWLQVLADVFGKTLQVPDISEGVAFGAAVLGFVSAGVLNDIADTGNLVAVEKSVQPAPAAVACYKRLYTIYEQVYWSLQPAFTEIASYQNEQTQ